MARMYFNMVIAKRGRKCSLCGGGISKGGKMFEYLRWLDAQKYPEKKNVCLRCAGSITAPEFLVFIQDLVKGLRGLECIVGLARSD